MMTSCAQLMKVRWIFGIMAFWGFFFNYATKVILSATLEAMVQPEGGLVNKSNCDPLNNLLSPSSSSSHFSNECDSNPDQVYDWSFETQNSLKEAFFYGYIMTGVIGGRLGEMFSVKHTVGTTVFISSILSLIIPFITPYGTEALFTVRLLQGLANGMIDPGLNTIFSRYIPINERSRWGSIVYSGSSLGTMIMLILSGKLSEIHELGGWRLAFYCHAILGLVWYTIWQIFIAERPEKHWFITDNELKEIKEGTQLDNSKKRHPIPWKQITLSVPFIAMAFASFVYNWAYLTMLTQLPKYFHRVLGFDVAKSDIISSLPYIAQSLFGYIGGMILDWLRKSGRFSISTLRKTFNTIGFMGPALCLMLNCFSGNNRTWAVTLITLNLGLCGFAISGFKIVNVDLSPTFAGTLLGIANTIGNVPGILAPMLVSKLVSDAHTISEWNRVFLVAAAFFFIGTLVFIIFGSADLQSWDPAHPSHFDANGDPIKSVDGHKMCELGNGKLNSNQANSFVNYALDIEKPVVSSFSLVQCVESARSNCIDEKKPYTIET